MDKKTDNIKHNKQILHDILNELKIMKTDTTDIKSDLSYIKSIIKVGETYPKTRKSKRNFFWLVLVIFIFLIFFICKL